MKLLPASRLLPFMKTPRKIFSLFLGVVLVSAVGLRGDLPAPEQLAPADATLVVTVPDWERAAKALEQTSFHRALNDPALKPLVDRIKADLVESLHGSMSDKDRKYFEEFVGLLKGQVTLVLGDAAGFMEKPDAPPVTFIVDVKDQGAKLADFMDRSLKDETDAHVVREKIAGGELITLVPAAAGKDDADSKGTKMYMATAGEMLVVGFERETLEKVLRRRTGATGDSLSGNPVFRADQARFFRDAKGWAWVNVARIVDLALKKAEPAKANPGNPFAMALDVRQILSALGLTGWKSLAVSLDYDEAGGDAEFFFNLPAGERRGLFKLFETEKRPSAPPTFIPGDVTKYARWRKDAQDLLNTLERTAAEAVPPFAGFISMMIDQAGKAKNPDFDFRRQFIGNLGNDLISLQWAPKAFSLSAITEPPTMYLIGSGNPAALMDALVTAQSAMGMPGMKAKEGEFLGQRVVSLPAGVSIGADGKPAGPKFVHVTTGRGYLVIGTDRERVEDFIRGGSKADSLAETAGFRQAVETAGGMGTGWMFFQNPVDTLKMMITAVKNDPNAIEKLIGPQAFKTIFIAPGAKPGDQAVQKDFKTQMADYIRLLPEFEKIRQYLNFSVGTVTTERDGILIRSFTPEPNRR